MRLPTRFSAPRLWLNGAGQVCARGAGMCTARSGVIRRAEPASNPMGGRAKRRVAPFPLTLSLRS
jgi:hypothetical protein